MEKRRGAISRPFHNIFYVLLDFHVLVGTRFSLRDKRLFEISEVEITRVSCISTRFKVYLAAVYDKHTATFQTAIIYQDTDSGFVFCKLLVV